MREVDRGGGARNRIVVFCWRCCLVMQQQLHVLYIHVYPNTYNPIAINDLKHLPGGKTCPQTINLLQHCISLVDLQHHNGISRTSRNI